MSITLNQAWSNAGTNTTNNVPLAYGSIPAAGDLLIAVFSLTDTQTLTSLADTIGDGVPWVQAGTTVHDNNSGSNNYVYYKTVGTPSGGAKTVTLTASATAGMVLSIAAYRSSVAGTWSTDGFISVINTTSTNPSPGSITTTAADGVVLGYVVKSGATPTAGTGFTLQAAPTGYFGYEGVEDQITTAAGSYTAAWVDGASSTWSALSAAFKWVTGAPAITAQPISTTVATGSSSIIFSVTATGATSYQWQRMPSGGSFADIGGATSSSYTTGVVTNATNNLDQYICNVTNASGTTASSAATLTVYATTTAAYTIEGDLCGMGAMASAPFSTVKQVASLVASPQTLTASLFTVSNTFYAGSISQGGANQTLTAGLFTATNTFNTHTTGASISLTAALFTNGNTFYAGTLTRGAVNLTPSLFTNSNTYYAASVSQGGTPQTLTATRFDNSGAFYSATLSSSIGLSATRHDNASTFYAANIGQVGAQQTLTASLFTNSNQLFNGTISGLITLTASIYNNAGSFYAASVTSSITLAAARYDNSNTFFSGSISQTGSSQSLVATIHGNTSTFYSHVVSGGSATIDARWKFWDGVAWVATTQKVWNGSAWV
jgi:hypothetical protein